MATEEYHHVPRNYTPSAPNRRLRSSAHRNKVPTTNLDGFSSNFALPSIEEPARSKGYWSSDKDPPSRERKISSLPELSRSSFLISGGQQSPDEAGSRLQSSQNNHQESNLPSLASSLPHLPTRPETTLTNHSSCSPMPPISISRLSTHSNFLDSQSTKKLTNNEPLPTIIDSKSSKKISSDTLRWHVQLKNGQAIIDKTTHQIPETVLKKLKRDYGHIDSFEVIVVKRDGKFTTLTRPSTNERKTPSLNMECERQI